MAWDKIVTTKGLALQAKILSGASVIVTRATLGGSFVEANQLPDLNDVSDYLSDVTINLNPPEQVSNRATIKTVITNDDVITQLTYYQIGIFMEDPDDGEILYLIAQNTTEMQIPPNAEIPGFQAKYDFEVLISSTSDITIQYNPESNVTHEQLNDALGEFNSELAYKAPINHKSQDTSYGIADETHYGHLKSDMDAVDSFSVQRKYLTEMSIDLEYFTTNASKSGIYDFNDVTEFINSPPDENIPTPASGYITVHKNHDRTITTGVELHIHGYSSIWLWGGGDGSWIEGGGSGGGVNPSNPTLIITAPDGSTVTITKDASEVTSFTATDAPTTITLSEFGIYTVTAALDDQTTSGILHIISAQHYAIQLGFFNALLIVNTVEGTSILVTDGTHNYSQIADSSGVVTFPILYSNTYTVFASVDDIIVRTVTVIMTTNGETYNIELSEYGIYGVAIDLTNSNPETSVTYTDDAIGMTPGHANWLDNEIYKDIKPCVLLNGSVNYYLDPNDYTKQINGLPADLSGPDGDIMVEFPKIGYKIEFVDTTLHVRITRSENKPGFCYYAHTREIEGDRDFLYIGAYNGLVLSSKLRSVSGRGAGSNSAMNTLRTAAQANGVGYDLWSFYPLTLIQCLCLIMYKNLNSKTGLGGGNTTGSFPSAGSRNTAGMYFSYTGNGIMKGFGIENLWGGLFGWIDGLFFNDSGQILTAFQNFNDTGEGYVNSYQFDGEDREGYLSNVIGNNAFGFIPATTGGTSTTYFCCRGSLKRGCVALYGVRDVNYTGMFNLEISGNPTISNAYSSRLMYL